MGRLNNKITPVKSVGAIVLNSIIALFCHAQAHAQTVIPSSYSHISTQRTLACAFHDSNLTSQPKNQQSRSKK